MTKIIFDPTKKLNDYERGFIECAIDTDGSISLTKNKNKSTLRGYTPRLALQFYNNSEDYLEKIKEILETNATLHPIKGKKCYVLQFSHQFMRWLLPQLTLVVKERKRQIALEMLELLKWGSRKDSGYEEMVAELYNQFKEIQNE